MARLIDGLRRVMRSPSVGREIAPGVIVQVRRLPVLLGWRSRLGDLAGVCLRRTPQPRLLLL